VSDVEGVALVAGEACGRGDMILTFAATSVGIRDTSLETVQTPCSGTGDHRALPDSELPLEDPTAALGPAAQGGDQDQGPGAVVDPELSCQLLFHHRSLPTYVLQLGQPDLWIWVYNCA